MAENETKDAGAEESKDAPKKKGKKTPLIIAAIMVVEGIAVFMLVGGGGPKKAAADVDAEHVVVDDSEKTQEVEVIDSRFQNLTTGKVWIWDIAIYAQVKNKHAERVTNELKTRYAEISEGINQIVSRAHHNNLKEPERQTLIRQLTAYLNKTIGPDAEGKPLIERVIIPKCNGFAADY